MNDDNLTTSSDNLENIKGIGEDYAKALNAIGVRSFADLARYDTPEELHRALLEQDHTRVSLGRIQSGDWIGQARELVAIQENDAEQISLAEEAETEAIPENGPDEKPWRQHAGFSIFFDYLPDQNGEQTWQTRVRWKTKTYHDESGDEENFPGFEPSLWSNWILEQAELPGVTEFPLEPALEESSAPSLTEAPVEAPSAPEETRIEIMEVKVVEIGPTSGIPEKQLEAQVRFQLTGPDAEQIVNAGTPFRLEIHTVNAENEASSLVASGRGKLQTEVFKYTHSQQFPMPEVGRYEIHCITLLLPPGQMVAFQAGPILNIVP